MPRKTDVGSIVGVGTGVGSTVGTGVWLGSCAGVGVGSSDLPGLLDAVGRALVGGGLGGRLTQAESARTMARCAAPRTRRDQDMPTPKRADVPSKDAAHRGPVALVTPDGRGADRVERQRVVEGGHVAGVEAEPGGPRDAPHDLAGPGLWQ